MTNTRHRSWAVNKWGIDPVIGTDNSNGDMITAFLKQQFDFLTESYDYSASFVSRNYTHSIVVNQLARLDALISTQGNNIITSSQIISALSQYVSILNELSGTVDLVNDPELKISIPEYSFPYWNTILVAPKPNSRYIIPFTLGYDSEKDIKLYSVLSNDNSNAQERDVDFVDALSVKTPDVNGQVFIYFRKTRIGTSVGADVLKRESLLRFLRRLHMRCMEIGQAMSFTKSSRVNDGDIGGVITKIEYRDRIVEKPVEVVKEVIREVPGPERVVEKVVTVPGETKYVNRDALVQLPVTKEITGESIKIPPDNAHAYIDAMVVVITKKPESYKDTVKYYLATKKTDGTWGRDSSLIYNSFIPASSDYVGSNILYASLSDPVTNDTKLRQVVLQGVRGVKIGVEQTIDQQHLAPVGWTWKYVLDADEKNSDLVNGKPQVNPSPSPAPNPTPTPNPSPVPPASSGRYMSLAEKQNVIFMATGKNQARPKGWTGGVVNGIKTAAFNSFGQYIGATVVTGGYLKWEPHVDWWETTGAISNRALFNKNKYRYFDIFQPWYAVMEDSSNTAPNGSAYVDVRNMKLLVLRNGSSEWEIVQSTNDIGWSNEFGWDMGTFIRDLGMSNNGQYGETLVPTNLTNIAHFGPSPWTIVGPETIVGIMVMAEARIAPRSPAGTHLDFQIGGDPKWNGDGSFMHWYPGYGLSATVPLSRDWRRVYHCNIYGAIDSSTQRTITQQKFLNSKVPVPDLNAGTATPAPTPPAQNTPAPQKNDGGTFADLNGRQNFVWVKQTPSQNGQNRWLVQFLGIENGKPMSDTVTENDQSLLNDRQWSGEKTFPAFVWTGGKSLPDDIGQYQRTTFTANRSNLNSTDPWHEIGIWKDNASVGDWSEATKK